MLEEMNDMLCEFKLGEFWCVCGCVVKWDDFFKWMEFCYEVWCLVFFDVNFVVLIYKCVVFCCEVRCNLIVFLYF